MGVFDGLRMVAGGALNLPERTTGTVQRAQIASPWQRDTLSALVWSDLLDTNALPVSRGEAMTVGAVARARLMVAGTIARVPLSVYRGDERLVDQPSWCQRTDQLSSPFSRMLWTVDDLIFHGESLWTGTAGVDGRPLALQRVPYGDWSVDGDGRIIIPGNVPAGVVVYIPGPHEGILSFAGRSIRAAAMLERSALDTARAPFRVELHQTTGAPMTPDEIHALVEQCRSALLTNGGVMYTNAAVEAKVHPIDSSQLLLEGRNYAAVDIARHVGIPAALIDANNAGASLTYETTTGRNRQFLDYTLGAYMTAVSARLGCDDVVPAGQRVAFEIEDLIGPEPSLSGPVTED